MKKHISAYSSVRFFWATIVVICHLFLSYKSKNYFISTEKIEFLSNGGFSVTNFFVMSGFLCCMHYQNKYSDKIHWSDGIVFALNHIKKIYILHIFTMIIVLCYFWSTEIFSVQRMVYLLKSVFFNIFLINTWYPTKDYSINGVSWYLSTLFFVYLFFPLILHFSNKIKKNSIIWMLMSVCLLICQFLSQYSWSYHSSFYRIFECMIGIWLYLLINQFSKLKTRIFPIVAVLFQMISYIFLRGEIYTLLSSIIFLAAFYLYPTSTKYNLLEKLGNMSLEIFLLHYPIVIIGSYLSEKIFPKNFIACIFVSLFLYIFSLLISYIWKYYIIKTKPYLFFNQKIEFIIDKTIRLVRKP